MNDRRLTCLALCLSVASLGYAAWLHHRTDYVAELALQKREAAFVSHMAPKLKDMYRDMGADMGVNENIWSKNPQTLEELFAPVIQIMDKMGGASAPDADTNSNSKVK